MLRAMFTNPQWSYARLREGLMAVLIFTWVGSVFALFPAPASPDFPTWPDGLLVICALGSALFSVAGYLPWQNVVALLLVVLVVAGSAFGWFAHERFPGPRLIFSEACGPAPYELVPWILLPAWMAIHLTAHGVARLILRPWRRGGTYGWWLIGVTVLLVTGFGLGLEAVAKHVKFYWRWEATGGSTVNLVWPAGALWASTALVVQLAGTPWWVPKKPGEPPPDFHPLVLWSLANVWLMAATATRGVLGIAAAVLGGALLTMGLAIYGATRSRLG